MGWDFFFYELGFTYFTYTSTLISKGKIHKYKRQNWCTVVMRLKHTGGVYGSMLRAQRLFGNVRVHNAAKNTSWRVIVYAPRRRTASCSRRKRLSCAGHIEMTASNNLYGINVVHKVAGSPLSAMPSQNSNELATNLCVLDTPRNPERVSRPALQRPLIMLLYP